MSTASDRRAPHATRIPFDAMVEVGGSLGPTFEAQAVNLSEEGMHLRTAYLPEVGQPISCRFDAGHGLVVVAAGEVLWSDPQDEGGEFGIRFTNLDTASAAALNRILGTGDEGTAAAGGARAALGRKVRLHIDGLASPMRARVKEADDTCVKAFSELGFLQVGKALEVEDTQTGTKRPAQIDGVAVELEQASRIPQLVVSLRYDAAEARPGYDSAGPVTIATSPAEDATDDGSVDVHEGEPEHAHAHAHADDEGMDEEHDDAYAPEAPAAARSASAQPAMAARASDDLDEESAKLKSPLARTASKITPTLESWAKRAKTTVSLLAARAARKNGGSGDDVAIPVRRTTAPAPGGGLHASGRKVVRSSVPDDTFDKADLPKAGLPAGITKKRAAIAGSVGIAVILAAVAMRKPATPPVVASNEGESAAVNALPAAPPAPVAPAPAPPPGPAMMPTDGPSGPMLASDPVADTGKPSKKLKVTPFGNGPVGSRGNILKLKMDGSIEKLLGASQPTGFTVVIPNRRSLDAAGPLVSKDPRIAAIHVSNEPTGAELTVTFKDGVPNYLVRANGDNLELVLSTKGLAVDKPAAAHAAPPPKKKHTKKR